MLKIKMWSFAAALALVLGLSACQGELVPGDVDDTAQVTGAAGAPEGSPAERTGQPDDDSAAGTADVTASPGEVQSRGAQPGQGTERPGEGTAVPDDRSGGDDQDDQPVSGIPATDPAGEVTPQVTAAAREGGLPITGACVTGLTIDELNFRGEEVFSGLCADCHGAEGEGRDDAPALTGNEEVNEEDVRDFIEEVLDEDDHNFISESSDEDLAAALTYVRNHFGDGFVDVICPEDVRAERED